MKILALLFSLIATSLTAAIPSWHQVEAGNTLFSISKQYGIPQDSLRKYNGLADDRVFLGQKLYLTPSAPTPPEPIVKRAIPVNGLHTVKRGETLYRIAKTYDLEVMDLVELNDLPSFAINPGQIIKLRQPAVTEKPAPAAKAKPVTKTTTRVVNSTHKIKKGETLTGIAKKYGMTLTELKSLNHLKKNVALAGTVLKVKVTKKVTVTEPAPETASAEPSRPAREPKPQPETTPEFVGYTVKPGDTLSLIAVNHNMTLAELKRVNDIGSEPPAPGRRLQVRQRPATPSTPSVNPVSKPAPLAKNGLVCPVSGDIVVHFGQNGRMFSKGVDIAAPAGEPVQACDSGEAVFVGSQPGYGNVVIVEHGDGFMSVYANNESNLVRQGDKVKQGQPVATVGTREGGGRLHFELRLRGKAQDPAALWDR